jgi:hypothetical protein
MRSTARIVVVFAVMIAGLAVLSSIAGARSRAADARDPERIAALAAMDEALARNDLPAAAQAWKQARELALRSRGWRAPAQTADAELRLAVATDRVRESKPTVRELFLIALFRARAEGSVDGALHAADGFARLGDHDAALLALRLAEQAAARNGEGADRVRVAADRIRRPAAPAQTVSSGS